MIRRNVRERLAALAGFIRWDADPYLVLTDEGRLVWTVDGYTTSAAHPYSSTIAWAMRQRQLHPQLRQGHGRRLRRHGTPLHLRSRPIPSSRPTSSIFPKLFLPASEMPADLRAHARYPETLFRAQAEIYRTFHMLDPQAFYNKEDLWDLARNVQGQDARPAAGDADLRGGHAARRDQARVPADHSVHAAQQGQHDRRDGGPLRRRAPGRIASSCSSPSRR